jgi:predicted DNA-binding transcriptional regulator AlpA
METKGNLIRSQDLRQRYGGVSDMTLWRWVRDGVIPQPVKINGRRYWRVADLDEIDAKREAASA